MQININRYITEALEVLFDEVANNSRIILEAPTGSGKSSFVLEQLPKKYNKILVVSPIRLITDEHSGSAGSDNQFTPLQELEHLSNNYLATTTDTLYNLYLKHPKEILEYLAEVPLVAFDEQHLIENAFGFRPKVLKAVDLIESLAKKLIYLSGTPEVSGMGHCKHIRVVADKNYTVTVFNNIFKDTSAVISRVVEELEHGSVLFYVSSLTKIKEVEGIFKNISTTVILNQHSSIYFQGAEYKNINELPIKGNKLYLSTSRATAGLNFKGLTSVFQYGSTYNSNNLVQLISRLRNTGRYYYIKPRYENHLKDLRMEQLEGLLKILRPRFNLARDFYAEVKPLVDSNELVLPSCTANGFIKTYHKALGLAEALGWLWFNYERDDFIVSEITDFHEAKNRLLKKEVDKITVDKLLAENAFEALNDTFNLSFNIFLDNSLKVLPKRVELITPTDKIDRLETNTKKKIAEIDFLGKTVLVQVLPIKDLRTNFTADELKALAKNKNINVERLLDIKTDKDRIVALGCYLIPKRKVFGVISKLLAGKDFVKVLDVDAELSKLYANASKLSKHPYVRFIIDLLESELNDSAYTFRASVNNKKYGNLKLIIVRK